MNARAEGECPRALLHPPSAHIKTRKASYVGSIAGLKQLHVRGSIAGHMTSHRSVRVA